MLRARQLSSIALILSSCASGVDVPAQGDDAVDDAARSGAVAVLVQNPDGSPLAGAPVAFYDDQQQLRQERVTDGRGRASARLGTRRGAVSVGRVLPSGEQELTTFLGVASGAHLVVREPAADPPSADDRRPAVAAAVSFPASVPGAARYEVYTPCAGGSAPAGEGPPVVTLDPPRSPCAGADGRVTYLGAALDAEGRPLAFASATAAAAAGEVALGVLEAPLERQLDVAGPMPEWSLLEAAVTLRAGGGAIAAPFWKFRSEVAPVSVRFLVPPSAAAETAVWLSTGGEGDFYWYAIESRWQRQGAVAHAAVELLPTLEKVSVHTQGAVPVIDWSAPRPLGALTGGVITVDWNEERQFHVWNIHLSPEAADVPASIAPPAPSPALLSFAVSPAVKYHPELRWLTFESAGADGVTRTTSWLRDSQ